MAQSPRNTHIFEFRLKGYNGKGKLLLPHYGIIRSMDSQNSVQASGHNMGAIFPSLRSWDVTPFTSPYRQSMPPPQVKRGQPLGSTSKTVLLHYTSSIYVFPFGW